MYLIFNTKLNLYYSKGNYWTDNMWKERNKATVYRTLRGARSAARVYKKDEKGKYKPYIPEHITFIEVSVVDKPQV